MHHIIIDLETLDVAPSAHILSVGAVLVDIDAPSGAFEIDARLLVTVSDQQPGRTITMDTIEWWLTQLPEARHASLFDERFAGIKTDLSQGCVSLARGMQTLVEFIERTPSGTPVWGNGSDFDNAICQHACRQIGIDWPWRRNRCLRTVLGLARDADPDFVSPGFPASKIKHHPLDDAEHEAHVLAAALHTLAKSSDWRQT
jgi:hypothetical protein